MNSILQTAKNAAQAAAEVIREKKNTFTVDRKSRHEIVTDVDVLAQEAVAKVIHEAFPDHVLYAEEQDDRASLNAENVWVVDPLDGTHNFAHGIPQYSVSVAYASGGIPVVGVVLDVVRGELFWAEQGKGAFLDGTPICPAECSSITNAVISFGFYYDRGPMMVESLEALKRLLQNGVQGVRRIGSAALDFCWVACGRFDGFFEYHLSPWDYAAGMVIAREAGVRMSDSTGAVLGLDTKGVIIGAPGVFDELQGHVRWDGPKV